MGSKTLVGVHAPQIWWPGAITSGLRTSAGNRLEFMKSGPLEENLLTTGALPEKVATLPSPIAPLAPNLVSNLFAFRNVKLS